MCLRKDKDDEPKERRQTGGLLLLERNVLPALSDAVGKYFFSWLSKNQIYHI